LHPTNGLRAKRRTHVKAISPRLHDYIQPLGSLDCDEAGLWIQAGETPLTIIAIGRPVLPGGMSGSKSSVRLKYRELGDIREVRSLFPLYENQDRFPL
jgi:hypothetical protein